MTWNSRRAWLATVLRLGLAVVWIWSGVAKLSSPRLFLYTVRGYDLTPDWLAKVFAYGLPTLALSLGILLVVGVLVRIAAAVSALLFLVFTIALLQAAVRGLKLRWGAFDHGGLTAGSPPYALEILLAVVLLLAAVFLVLWPFSWVSLDAYLSRHDYVEPPSAKRLRSDQGLRKYEAEVERKDRQARIRDRYLTTALSIVVVLVVIIAVGVADSSAKLTAATSTDNVSGTYGVVYGKVAAARVDIYEDFSCVTCRTFYNQVQSVLEADVKANKAQVHYYSVAFIDDPAGKSYSLRAANAAYCVADDGVDAFVKYHDVLYGKNASGQLIQPKPGGSAPTNDDLAGYGKLAGLTSTQQSTLTTCIADDQYTSLVQTLTDHVSQVGITKVPTVKVNGQALSNLTLASLEAAISGAAAKGPKPSPSPTASPSKSASGSASATTSPSPAASSSPKASGSPAG